MPRPITSAVRTVRPLEVLSNLAFTNGEIRHIICIYLPRHDLCQVSYVSKDWERTASALIWRDLPSVQPFVHLLPKRLVTRGPGSASYKDYHRPSSGDLQMSKRRLNGLRSREQIVWNRLQPWAVLIKKLCLRIDDLGFVEALTSWSDSPPFPFLEGATVQAHNFGEKHVTLLKKLLPGHLAGLTFYESAQPTCQEHLLAFASSFTSVQQLYLSVSGDGRMQKSTEIGTALCSSGVHILLTLATFSSLRVLVLFCRWSIELPMIPRESFRALTSLTLQGSLSDEIGLLVLRSLQKRHPMEGIHILYGGASREDSEALLLEAVHDSCDEQALRTVKIMSFACEPERTKPIDLAHIQPLSSFSQITTLVLGSEVSLALSDADSTIVASWWPSIRELQLHASNATASVMTLGALASFADQCPDLVKLVLAFNARAETQQLPTPEGRSHSRLETLDVCCSPIDAKNVMIVAYYLAALFPLLQDISCDANSKYEQIWADVLALVLESPRDVTPKAPGSGALSSQSDPMEDDAVGSAMPMVIDGDESGHSTKRAQPVRPSSQANIIRQDGVSSQVASWCTGVEDAAARDTEAGGQDLAQTQRVTDLEQLVAQLEAQLQERNNELEDTRTKLERRYSTMEDKLFSDIRTLERRNADLEKEKTEIEQRYSDVEQDRDAQGKKSLQIQCDYEDFKRRMSRDLDTLRQKLGAVEGEKEALQGRFDWMSREKEEQKHAFEQDREQREQLEKHCADLERWKRDCKQRLQGLVSLE
ncbi:hypothetical protein BD626DRAFT_573735 [Schizophyllum amplum]|uniref:F-box domain-containing protein n=1 Tax=Schizophyllum amplum TaxID=97359 RepID=A0A550C0K0_9AGAR|nr:hypothetical protein BD626DRAFT_573735 [Auriculariopsis ampla]